MTIRKGMLAAVAALSLSVSLSLCGCTPAAPPTGTPADTPTSVATASAGSIELAVADTCMEGSDPECIRVDNEYVLRPDAFESAPVADAAASESQQKNAIDVTFTTAGAAVLGDLTEQAVKAGADSRLLIKVGDDILTAVHVMAPLHDDHLAVALLPDQNAEDVLGLLHDA